MSSFLKIILLFFLLLFLALSLRYCFKSETEGAPFAGYHIRLSGQTAGELKSQLESGLGITLTPENFHVCPCDSSLVNLTLSDVTIEGHGPAQVKTGTGGVGLDLDIDYGKNYLLASETDSLGRNFIGQWLSALKDSTTGSVKEGRFNPYSLTNEERAGTGAENLVAIFDSGIHPDLMSLPYQNALGLPASAQNLLCVPPVMVPPASPLARLFGINFMPETDGSLNYGDIRDQTLMQHGTKVTHLLASQRIGRVSAPLRVMTMKVLNRENRGDLFSLMCAMSQAKKMGARIFNMSLGYYGSEDSLFRSYIQSLASDKIWLVTAAGNALPGSDIGSTDLPENRDLDQRPLESKFFPAFFARDMNHVIAVTTVHDGPDKVCDMQNYGKSVVDVGVLANDCKFAFNAPGQQVTVRGSSYATPVVAGWIARKPNLGSYSDKAALLGDALADTALESKIKGGKYIKPNGN
ncbi:hypothetical protein GCM10023091_12910 [Ravibacter arvi]|uniref:Peptidase S8/S53 domain-containing protein n=1 Tax=Ravibacter arvi TaxID=2051041 RepID=A0ABP8LVK7_9BACT